MDALTDFGYVVDLTQHHNEDGPRQDPITKACTTHLQDPLRCPRPTEHIDIGVGL